MQAKISELAVFNHIIKTHDCHKNNANFVSPTDFKIKITFIDNIEITF